MFEKDQENPRQIDPVGAKKKARESDFYKPIGKKLRLLFKNTGKTKERVSIEIIIIYLS